MVTCRADISLNDLLQATLSLETENARKKSAFLEPVQFRDAVRLREIGGDEALRVPIRPVHNALLHDEEHLHVELGLYPVTASTLRPGRDALIVDVGSQKKLLALHCSTQNFVWNSGMMPYRLA
ncbi:hypothetical protein SDC9_150773 [bioreactor metagenome]|uniref:Uncharacterized protein n=1 Tax=bioreactor metagenome TaxID=1076179 RepID=A0A645ESQ1_9ZZZZ